MVVLWYNRPMLLKNHPLFSEYSLTKNHYDLDTLKTKSGKKAWWVCKNNHEWESRICSRTDSGNGCRYCSKRSAYPGETDIATVAPWLTKQFKYPERATKYLPSSNIKEVFVCSNGHERTQTIASAFKGSGCKYCAGLAASEGNNFNSLEPEKSKHLKDYSVGFKYTRKSEAETTFICNLGHEFVSTFARVTGSQSFENVCPYCSNRKVLVGFNDLWTTHPDVAVKLLDQTDGYKYTKGVKDKIHFVCKRGHSYSSAVHHATSKNPTGCPQCYEFTTVTLPEIDLLYFLRHYVPVSQYKGYKISRVDIQAMIAGFNVGIEYDGAYHHHSEEAFKRDKVKTDKMLDHFDLVVRIRAYDPKYVLQSITVDPNYKEITTENKTLEECSLEIIEWVTSRGIIDKETK